MAYTAVVALSLLVGVGVYAGSLRSGSERQVALGFEPGEGAGETLGTAPAAGPGYTYLRIPTRRLSWRDRIQGFVWLVILVGFATALLALAIYEVGHLVNITITRFLHS
jgi:hypothetical protein